jgi:DNA-binding NtrC family response regulator
MSFRHILIVEARENLKHAAQAELDRFKYQTVAAGDALQALEILGKEPVDLILVDLDLPAKSGLELLRRIGVEHPEIRVIMVTSEGSIESAVEAMKLGAYDFITKPVHPDALRSAVNRALEPPHQTEEVRLWPDSVEPNHGFENIMGKSEALLRALDLASRLAQTDAPVLIVGETGTGKETLARAIHSSSPRRERPFVVIHCGSTPNGLLESKMFGHTKELLPGAIGDKMGKVEMAEGGTIFLEEISEVPLSLQPRVLRLIREREIEKVGATRSLKVDVRVIAATRRNLKTLVAEGRFREDLYYELATIPIELPPLRNRGGDVEMLVPHFFECSKLNHRRLGLRLHSSVLPYLIRYEWPGNVRELENLIERIVLLCRSDEVTLADLPDYVRHGRSAVDSPLVSPAPEGIGLEKMEREMILQALRRFHWNQTQAAKHLEISRKTLRYRMVKHGIERGPDPPQERPAKEIELS